jgi:TRAP-type C4-dicarboxylate transport system substrate-binding protein
MVSESNLTLHMSKPLKTLNNLDGEKILVPTKLNGDAVERLGGTPLALPFEDAYTALQRDTVDGMLFPWTGVQTFKLADVTTYHADTPFGGGAGMVFMSREKFDSLPPQVQKILQDNSGEAMAHRHGESLDKVQDEIRTAVKADPKQQVVMLSPRQGDSWHQRLASLADTWAKNTPDGEKVLATYRQLVAQVKASR